MLNRDDRGAMAIIVALFAVAMFILGSMVVQAGGQRESRGDAQNAADAAALAAAEVLADATGTRNAAVAAAAKFAAANNFPPGSSASDYFVGCTAKVPRGWQRSSLSSCVSFKPEPNGNGTKWTEVQIVTPTVTQDGLFGAADTNTRARAWASIDPGAPTSPPVLFGGSTSCPNAVEWNALTAEGDIHSNNDLTVGTGTVNGEGTYRGAAANASFTNWTPATNNPVNVSADEDPRPYPKTYDIADFRAGGRWRSDANFHGFPGTVTGRTLRIRGFITGGTLLPGIYYTTGNINLSGNLNNSAATLVSDGGSITVAGNVTLTPYADDLQLFTTLSSSPDCSETGVSLNGSALSFQGVIYSPEAAISIRNADDVSTSAGGSLMGLTVRGIDSSSLNLTELPRTIAGPPEIHLSK